MQRDILIQILPLMTVTVFALGTIVGSFLNVVVWRLPRGESLVHPGSHCPGCNHAIRPWENIPIVSWLFLRAKCSSCGCPISIRYPLVELATGLVYLLLWWRVWTSDMPLSTIWGYLFLGSALIAASLIDFEHTIIPDRITFTGIAAAVILALVWPESHLQQDLAGAPDGSHLILDWFLDVTAPVAGKLWRYPRARALTGTVLGAAFGYGMLWMLLQAGKRLWGNLRIELDPAAEAVLDPHGLRVGDDLQESWEELFFRKTDRCRAHATVLTVQLTNPDRARTYDDAALTASRDGLTVGEDRFAWADVRVARGSIDRLLLPREAMGFGDLKLLAMVGAFLGADSTVFVLMIAAAAGCLAGTVHIALTPRHRHAPIPFGPFIAAAALVWIALGQTVLQWYVRRFL